tara:strand:- start:369 stop:629 length:261 start_codon:yes stop_codon:yes gene_type:complete
MDLEILFDELNKLYGKKKKGEVSYSTSLNDTIRAKKKNIFEMKNAKSKTLLKRTQTPVYSIDFSKCPYLNMIHLENIKKKSIKSKL